MNWKVCAEAGKTGNSDIVKWLFDNGFITTCITYEIVEDICSSVAFSGNIELLQWLRLQGCEWCEITPIYAILGNNLSVLKYVLSEGCPSCNSLRSVAWNSNNISIYEWLVANNLR